MVIDYRNELKERGYAPATIALHLSAISSFCRHAVEVGLIDVNPVRGVKWPGVEPYAHVKAGVAKLTADDGDLALLASIDTTTETGKRDRAIILLLLAKVLVLLLDSSNLLGAFCTNGPLDTNVKRFFV